MTKEKPWSVVVLTTQEGDWEGFFINGRLVDEGHELGEGNSRTFLLRMAEKYNFTSKDLVIDEVTDEDDALIEKIGAFPPDLKEFEGVYKA